MGLLKTVATVAVASSVHGRIQRRQQTRWAQQDAEAGLPVQAPLAAAPAAAPPAPTAAPLSMIDELRQLGELRDAGILTEVEFDQQKARVLAGPR